MRGARPWILAATLAPVVSMLAWRAGELASIPPFQPGVVLPRPPGFELHGVDFSRETPLGTLRIRAERLRPGHETIGFFKLGPCTFLLLEQVTIHGADRQGCRWVVHGSRARLDPDRIRFHGSAAVVRAGSFPARRRGVVVNLHTGRIAGGR